MVPAKKTDTVLIIDFFGLSGILSYAFFSSLFYSDFAKVHIDLPFLNFPIFISEILLFVLLILLILKLGMTRQWRPWHKVWGIYMGGVCLAAGLGYIRWGPLALRHAALFYYAWFALLGHSFYNQRIFLSRTLTATVLFILILTLGFIRPQIYFWYTYLILTMVIIIKIFPSPWRFFVIAVALVCSHLKYLFIGSRAHMIGILGAVLFLVFVNRGMIYKISFKKRLCLIAAFLIIFIMGVAKISDKNSIKSLLDWPAIIKLYNTKQQILAKEKGSFHLRPLSCQLYNPNDVGSFTGDLNQKMASFNPLSDQKELHNGPIQSTAAQMSQVSVQSAAVQISKTPVQLPGQKFAQEMPGPAVSTYRDLDVANANILFRFFIWKDMFDELWSKHKFLGVGFGEPQRSPSLEMQRWAEGEWSRDGWITPHNFFLHVIYRAGVIGILLIFGLISALVYLTGIFISRKDVSGLLLTSILIYWCFQSAFSVTLEFPHFAILFWSLFGMIFAYAAAGRPCIKERIDGA